MGNTDSRVPPGFLQGTEVARYRQSKQPGFSDQLSLIKTEPEIKKKLIVAGSVILGAFFLGMIAGAVVGFFI